jgi:hypothetical protein
MSHEGEYHHPMSHHGEVFGLTDNEDLFEQVGEARFQQLLNDPTTEVVAVEVSTNSFGEYLFVTLRRQVQGKPIAICLYGLGYHEYRETWQTTVWKWYPTDERASIPLSKERVQATIQERRAAIAPYVDDTAPSQRAILYSLLADLTDEDGALTELDDLDDLFDDLE